jgi:hypothetical protein
MRIVLLLAFDVTDLIDPPSVTAAVERCREPELEDRVREAGPDDPASDRKQVRVVVRA